MLRGWTCLFYDKTINNEYLTMTHIYLYYYIVCVFKLFPESRYVLIEMTCKTNIIDNMSKTMDVTTINMQSKNINVLLSKLQFRLASNVEKNEYYSYNDIQYAIMYLVIICIKYH